MENPHKFPPPNDPVERVRALARDLAYGAITQLWSTEIRAWAQIDGSLDFSGMAGGEAFQAMLSDKWQNNYPGFNLLVALGYIKLTDAESRVAYYAPTEKAFALLEEPAAPPTAFISYGRKQSSAFALMLECRLASVGVRAFVDRSIDPGMDWHSHLQQMVRGSGYLVCLLAPGTLNSTYVREEIQWAVESKITGISIWHGGFTFNKSEIPACPDWLEAFVTSKHAIRVQEESAEGYHDAAEKLLNRLGYLT